MARKGRVTAPVKNGIRLLGLLIGLLVLTCACSRDGKQPEPNSSAGNPPGRSFLEPTDISVLIGSHSSWPYNPEWKMWD